RVTLTSPRRRDLHAHERRWIRGALARVDEQWKRIGHRRASVPAFAERSSPSEHQQAAASTIDEVRNHLQLVTRKCARFDAADDQTAIRKQLFAALREATDELLGVGVRAKNPHVLVVCGSLKRDNLEVLVVRHGAAQELHLEARLALEVEDPFLGIADVDEGLAHIVLRDELALDRSYAEGEETGTRLGPRRADPDRWRPRRTQ